MARLWGKKARNREVIMNAAKKLFEADGMDRITFSDIAKEAGMSRTTIFNHFPTIGDLMLAMVDDEFQNLLDYYETTRLEGRELIMALFNRLIDDTCDHPVLSAKLISVLMINREEHHVLGAFTDLIRVNLPEDMNDEQKADVVTMLIGNYLGLISCQVLQKDGFNKNKMKRRFALLSAKVF